MPTWAAEIEVDEELAATLIAEQFPELAGAPLELLGEGWDNMAYRVDHEWVFRFPRRQVVVAELEKEIAFLPRLEPLLDVAIPVPEHIGRPSTLFPWPFFGARFLPGVEAYKTEVDRGAVAADLGTFLRELHSQRVLDLFGELPENWTRRADMEKRVPFVLEKFAQINDLWQAPESVRAILDEALALPPPSPVAVCHGDLHFRHVLFTGEHLSAVIDWIDLCRGEPALDLQIVWSFFEPDERPAFFVAYGKASDDALLRARVIAFSVNAALVDYAHTEGLPSVEREALDGLNRSASGAVN